MNRRTFLSLTTAALVIPGFARATGQAYTPGLVEQLLVDGKTVFLDFRTDWCATCAAQGRVIEALRGENAAYAANISFVAVDWDQYSDGDLARRLRIPRRSTLVVLKGDAELGRIVAGTAKAQIKALMDTALTAATG